MNVFQPFPMFYAQPRLYGRMVSSANDISVGDIPTDGNWGWFPVFDGSCVWAKRWNANGTIETVKYVEELVQGPSSEDDLRARIEALEAAVAKPKRRKEAVVEADRLCSEAA